jgi:ribosome-associated protein
MTTSTAVKKDVQKLQRAIVDGLEDVKAQDIQVFDTEHLSALFERVIVASGTSNRQTKALAASVRDAVRDAGFAKPRVEGEVNGEWIIVDCGQAVVHIMQPTYRQYYNLEELWGEKPVRLKLGAAKPAAAAEVPKAAKAAPKGEPSLRRSNAAKKGVQEAFPSKAQLKKAEAVKAGKKATMKAPMKKPATKSAVAKAAAPKAPAKKSVPVKVAAKTVVVKAPARTAAKVAVKAAARKPAARKPAPRQG